MVDDGGKGSCFNAHFEGMRGYYASGKSVEQDHVASVLILSSALYENLDGTAKKEDGVHEGLISVTWWVPQGDVKLPTAPR